MSSVCNLYIERYPDSARPKPGAASKINLADRLYLWQGIHVLNKYQREEIRCYNPNVMQLGKLIC